MRASSLAAIALALWASAVAAGDPSPAPLAIGVLERDLPRLVEMFEGDWDNAEQVSFAEELGFPDGAPPLRRHVTVRRIEAPGLGQLVLRLDEYRNNDPSDVGRQRFYVFAVDPAKMIGQYRTAHEASVPLMAFGWMPRAARWTSDRVPSTTTKKRPT